ncbi:hypothetical protein BZG36_03781 [Bifiguratus adelaidae]|uniref:Cyclic nucleotide-binding domain-containing protein n=1 Tax=Bifiguratus adelaidae TaxID=1938954 RepID=A0A261XXI4_9FUNG|nr:hypothetical protein BZG36_03781 [Bifiguratus adelaidae]
MTFVQAKQPIWNNSSSASSVASNESMDLRQLFYVASPKDTSSSASVPGDETLATPIPDDLRESLRSHSLFIRTQNETFIEHVARRMRLRQYGTGDVIIRQGDPSKALFLLLRGTVRVCSQDGESVYAELDQGNFFGEIGILFSVKRTASVIAKTKCLTATFTAEDLQCILPNYPEVEKILRYEAEERWAMLQKKLHGGTPSDVTSSHDDSLLMGSLNDLVVKVPLFQHLPEDCIHKLSVMIEPRCYAPHRMIVEKGETGTEMYFVTSGIVEVLGEKQPSANVTPLPSSPTGGRNITILSSSDADKKQYVTLAKVTSGQYFGEIGCFLDIPRVASARAITNVEVFVLSRASLWSVIAEYPEIEEHIRDKAFERLLSWDKRAKLGDWSSYTTIPSKFTTNRQVEGRLSPMQIDVKRRRSPSPNLPESAEPEALMSGSQEDTLYDMAPPSPDSSISPRPTVLTVKNTCPSVDPYAPLTPTSPPKQSYLSSSLSPPSPCSSLGSLSPAEETGAAQSGEPVSKLVGYETRKRRLSVAVWSDPGLLQQVANIQQKEGPAISLLSNLSPTGMQFESKRHFKTDTEEGLQVPGKGVPRILDLDVEIMARIWKHVDDIAQVITCRAVCDKWNSWLVASSKISDSGLFEKVDLSRWNHGLNDETFAPLAIILGDRVKELNLHNCFHLTGASIKIIARGNLNITSLNLSSCWEITDDALASLAAGCPFLDSLNLGNCRKITDKGIYKLLSGLTSHEGRTTTDGSIPTESSTLSDLCLSYCKSLSDQTMRYLLLFACDSLETLNIQRCTSITDDGFLQWASDRDTPSFPNLKHINLTDCTFLTDAAVSALAIAAPNLETTNLTFCCALTDLTLETLASQFPNLREVDMAFCGTAVSDSSLELLSEGIGAQLEALSVRGCVGVTDVGVKAIFHAAVPHHLRYLNISQCNGVSSECRMSLEHIHDEEPMELGRPVNIVL